MALNRIKFLRLLKGMKQAELAKKILVSQSSLSGYESGKFEPDCKTLLKLADFFNVSVDYLLGRDSPLTPESQLLQKIPVYSPVPDGPPEKLPVLCYYQETNPCDFGAGEYFGFYINKDCMEPRILAGDMVIAHRQKKIPNASIVVAQIGEKKMVVKKFYRLENGGIAFLPYNPNYGPDYFTAEQVASLPVQILGIAVELRRKIR